MRERGFPPLLAAACAACALLLALVLTFALRPGDTRSSTGAIESLAGIPVGVRDTPAGALAATDNYVALASQSVEQDPALFSRLVAQVYVPAARAGTLAKAQRIRSQDVPNMSNYEVGGRGLAVVAARRLDGYSPTGARITSWLGGFVWGPHLSPRQSWNLIETTLRWQSGRWLVVAMDTSATPAPVPAVVYVDGANDQAQAFARLNGMSAPDYGSGE
jgi:hypothetical protein